MSRSLSVFWLGLLGFIAPVHAEAGGRVSCEITENGGTGSGVVSIQRDGHEIATGACGHEFSVPEGDYIAALRLDGALDGPEQKQPLSIRSGLLSKLKADFATGVLEVRVTNQGRRAAGLAIIKRNGQQLGTLGTGVGAHLSAGTYRILVRYRTHEKDLGDVNLAAGQRVALDATFE
jgi:hypothetical protein